MKALSLTQPMAWAIFHGKDVENRTWPTKFRGRIYIHASRGFNLKHWLLLSMMVDGGELASLPDRWEFVHRAIIGEVTIVDCVQHHTSRWAMEGQWQFVLEGAKLYEKPIPCKGMLGFFTPELTEVKVFNLSGEQGEKK